MKDAHKRTSATFDFISFVWPSFSRQMTNTLDAGAPFTGGTCDSGETRNDMLWSCVLFALSYGVFNRIFNAVLIRHGFARHSCNATIRFTWNCCFHAAALLCLDVYYYMNLATPIQRDISPLFPKYESPLVMPTENCPIFASLTNILMAYYVTSALVALQAHDYSEGVIKIAYVLVLSSLNANGLENFSVMINIWVSLFYLAAEAMQLIALHTDNVKVNCLVPLLVMRIATWTYAWLHMLPFEFLLPTLNAKKFKMWLSLCLWIWYGANVWYSPILYYCYHQFYHQYEFSTGNTTVPFCTGHTTLPKCVLVKLSPDYLHHVSLRQAYDTIQLRLQQQRRNSKDSANRAFQTVKCVMALKRKLKRIRAKNSPNRDPVTNLNIDPPII